MTGTLHQSAYPKHLHALTKKMSPRIWIVLGALLAAIGVGLGAYHAHGLEKMLQERSANPSDIDHQMRDFEVGVRYQLMHAITIVLVGVLALQMPSGWFNAAGALFVAGTLLFSGCLCGGLLAGMKTPWYLVPAGGLAFIAGWTTLALGAVLTQRDPNASVDQG
jgi:uncharacterized membrane protein YgdD (TMEM256/DUF423 family)